jgi:hypothetical protein
MSRLYRWQFYNQGTASGWGGVGQETHATADREVSATKPNCDTIFSLLSSSEMQLLFGLA